MTNTTLSTNSTDSSDEMFFLYFYAIFGPVVMVVFLFSMKFFFEDEVDALFCKDRADLNRSRTLSLSVREFEMKKTEERRGSASSRQERLPEGNLHEYGTPDKYQETQNSESSIQMQHPMTPEYATDARNDLSFSSPSSTSFGDEVGRSPLFPPPPPSLSEDEEVEKSYSHQRALKFIVSSAPVPTNADDIMNEDNNMDNMETRKGDPGFKLRQDSVSEDQSKRKQRKQTRQKSCRFVPHTFPRHMKRNNTAPQ